MADAGTRDHSPSDTSRGPVSTPDAQALDLYRSLLANPAIAADEAEFDKHLAQLESAGLVEQTPEGPRAVAPFGPMNALVHATGSAHTRMREAADALEIAWKERADRAGDIEVFYADTTDQALRRVLAGASQILAMHRPIRIVPAMLDGTIELLASGVEIRVV